MTDTTPASAAALDVTDRVVVVTGGTSGIGQGIAEALAAAGAKVAVCGRNEAKNAAAGQRLAAIAGDRTSVHRCDVADEADTEAFFAAVDDLHGPVFACFANAGVGSAGKPFVEETLDGFRQTVAINLEGTFLTLRAAAQRMVAAGNGGRLVATSSTASIMGPPRGQSYAASKAGQLAMMQALAVELGKHGITANSLVPGWIESEMTGDLLAWERFNEKVLPRVPATRWGVPSDFAGIAHYLVSDASAYHTGATFTIDGGYTRF